MSTPLGDEIDRLRERVADLESGVEEANKRWLEERKAREEAEQNWTRLEEDVRRRSKAYNELYEELEQERKAREEAETALKATAAYKFDRDLKALEVECAALRERAAEILDAEADDQWESESKRKWAANIAKRIRALPDKEEA